MERVGEWLWREHQRRFLVLVLVAASTFVGVTVMVPAVVIGSLFLDLRRSEGLVWLASVAALVGVAYVPLLAMRRRQIEPLMTWVNGDHGDPESAWKTLMVLPQDIAWRAGPLAIAALGATTFPLVVAMADTDAQGIVALGIAYVLVTATTTLLISSVAQVIFRPAVADLARRMGRITEVDDGSLSIASRLVLVTFVVSLLSGASVSASVLGTSASSNDYLVALGGGAIWAAYLSWIFHVGLLQPTFRPLADVVEATARVRRGDLATPVPVSSSDELGQLAVAFNEMQLGLAEREALRGAFGSYVDPVLAQRLIESGSAMFTGEEVVLTVLFADVRNFTAYAEALPPGQVVDRLNALFEVMVPVLHEYGGHANHYLGDGLLAVFGAPQPLVDHADAAVAAAVEIQRRVLLTFGPDLRLGIGLNTGPVIAGTIGGGGRHEFTVIGDTVNVAARVEQLTKETSDPILITEATRGALSRPRPRSTKRGDFEIRGKTTKLTLHAINPFPKSTR